MVVAFAFSSSESVSTAFGATVIAKSEKSASMAPVMTTPLFAVVAWTWRPATRLSVPWEAVSFSKPVPASVPLSAISVSSACVTSVAPVRSSTPATSALPTVRALLESVSPTKAVRAPSTFSVACERSMLPEDALPLRLPTLPESV